MRCALIIGLWLAAGSPAICCDLSTVEAATNCTQHALAQGAKDLHGQLSYEREYTITYGYWEWGIYVKNVTGLDSFVVKNVAVKVEGDRLRVTFSVSWSDVVVHLRQYPLKSACITPINCPQLRGNMNITGRTPSASGNVLYYPSKPNESSTHVFGKDHLFAFSSSTLDNGQRMEAYDKAEGYPTATLGLKLAEDFKTKMGAILSHVINHLNAYVIKAFKAAKAFNDSNPRKQLACVHGAFPFCVSFNISQS